MPLTAGSFVRFFIIYALLSIYLTFVPKLALANTCLNYFNRLEKKENLKAQELFDILDPYLDNPSAYYSDIQDAVSTPIQQALFYTRVNLDTSAVLKNTYTRLSDGLEKSKTAIAALSPHDAKSGFILFSKKAQISEEQKIFAVRALVELQLKLNAKKDEFKNLEHEIGAYLTALLHNKKLLEQQKEILILLKSLIIKNQKETNINLNTIKLLIDQQIQSLNTNLLLIEASYTSTRNSLLPSLTQDIQFLAEFMDTLYLLKALHVNVFKNITDQLQRFDQTRSEKNESTTESLKASTNLKLTDLQKSLIEFEKKYEQLLTAVSTLQKFRDSTYKSFLNRIESLLQSTTTVEKIVTNKQVNSEQHVNTHLSNYDTFVSDYNKIFYQKRAILRELIESFDENQILAHDLMILSQLAIASESIPGAFSFGSTFKKYIEWLNKVSILELARTADIKELEVTQAKQNLDIKISQLLKIYTSLFSSTFSNHPLAKQQQPDTSVKLTLADLQDGPRNAQLVVINGFYNLWYPSIWHSSVTEINRRYRITLGEKVPQRRHKDVGFMDPNIEVKGLSRGQFWKNSKDQLFAVIAFFRDGTVLIEEHGPHIQKIKLHRVKPEFVLSMAQLNTSNITRPIIFGDIYFESYYNRNTTIEFHNRKASAEFSYQDTKKADLNSQMGFESNTYNALTELYSIDGTYSRSRISDESGYLANDHRDYKVLNDYALLKRRPDILLHASSFNHEEIELYNQKDHPDRYRYIAIPTIPSKSPKNNYDNYEEF